MSLSLSLSPSSSSLSSSSSSLENMITSTITTPTTSTTTTTTSTTTTTTDIITATNTNTTKQEQRCTANQKHHHRHHHHHHTHSFYYYNCLLFLFSLFFFEDVVDLFSINDLIRGTTTTITTTSINSNNNYYNKNNYNKHLIFAECFSYRNQNAWGGECQTNDQSPINIEMDYVIPAPVGSPPIDIYFFDNLGPLIVQVHTKALHIDLQDGQLFGVIRYNNFQYELKTMHMHAPGEHTFTGARILPPLSLHIVGFLNDIPSIVIAISFDDSNGNTGENTMLVKNVVTKEALDELFPGVYNPVVNAFLQIANIPVAKKVLPLGYGYDTLIGAPTKLSGSMFLQSLLNNGYFPMRTGQPAQLINAPHIMTYLGVTGKKVKFYMYNGSKTQPGCEKPIEWLVMMRSSPATTAQLTPFVESNTFDGVGNNRYTQPLDGRTIFGKLASISITKNPPTHRVYNVQHR